MKIYIVSKKNTVAMSLQNFSFWYSKLASKKLEAHKLLSGYWSKFEAILHEFALRVPIAFRTRSGLFSVPQCVIYQVWVLIMTCKKVWRSYLSSKKFATMLKFYFRAALCKEPAQMASLTFDLSKFHKMQLVFDTFSRCNDLDRVPLLPMSRVTSTTCIRHSKTR